MACHEVALGRADETQVLQVGTSQQVALVFGGDFFGLNRIIKSKAPNRFVFVKELNFHSMCFLLLFELEVGMVVVLDNNILFVLLRVFDGFGWRF